MAKRDLQSLAKTIADKVNKRLGGKYVEDAPIQELNFVSKEDARQGQAPARDKGEKTRLATGRARRAEGGGH